MFALTLVLQVSLTVIAGNHLVGIEHNFKTSLLSGSHPMLPRAPYLWLAQQTFGPEHGSQKSPRLEVPGAAAAAGDCCNSASCSTSGLQCCVRSLAQPRKSAQPVRPLDVRVNDTNVTRREKEKLERLGVNASIMNVVNASFLDTHNLRGDRQYRLSEAHPAGADRRSLCYSSPSGSLSCNPPSYAFVDRWIDLDEDEDGVWSLEEARTDAANLGCRLGIPTEDIFKSICRGIIVDVEDTAKHRRRNYSFEVPLSISEYQSIPKSYFEWWVGIVVLCVEFDTNRCTELVGKGLFDGAIDSGQHGTGQRWTKGGVRDLHSAVEYCHRLLRPGGICERTLPGMYLTHRARVAEKCGTPSFAAGSRYASPLDESDAIRRVDVSYGMVSTYEKYSTRRFRVYVWMLLMIWYIGLLYELRDIVKFADFLHKFRVERARPRRAQRPATAQSQAPATEPTESDQEWLEYDKAAFGDKQHSFTEEDIILVVDVIAFPHWLVCIFVCIVRFLLVVYMFHAGTMFLLTTYPQGFISLLLNSVALAFILDLPAVLYVTLMSDRAKTALESAHTIEYESGLPTSGFGAFCLSKATWGLIILPVVTYWLVSSNYEANVTPILEALRCACQQEGQNCEVSRRFTRDWWNNYWQQIHLLFAMNKGSYTANH